jgi:hypothetical protein
MSNFAYDIVRSPKRRELTITVERDRVVVITDVVDVLVSFVRAVRLRRELSAACVDPHLSFWRVIYGNCTDMAVLEWCKLFGSDDNQNQPVHWKSVASNPDNFRKSLFSTLGIHESKWRSYWQEMKTYRPQAVAHHDQRRFSIKAYPKFDLALDSAYFYYDFARAELGKLGVDQRPERLKDYGDAFAAQCRLIAPAALEATQHFKESVL